MEVLSAFLVLEGAGYALTGKVTEVVDRKEMQRDRPVGLNAPGGAYRDVAGERTPRNSLLQLFQVVTANTAVTAISR
jgi:hypothetical protein